MTPQQVYEKIKSVFDRYGVPEGVWYPIALAESNLNPNAVGDNGASIGVFQINRVTGQGIGYTADQLTDPVTNAEIAAKTIVPAYRALADQVPESQLAAEVARRSGHPGGSIANPFPASDSRIQRIQTLANDFISNFQTIFSFPRTQAALQQAGNVGTDVQTVVSQDITAAVDTAVAPLKPIGEAVQAVKDRFDQIGAAGLLFGVLGLALVVITLAAMFAESNAGKATAGAAKSAVVIGAKAAAA